MPVSYSGSCWEYFHESSGFEYSYCRLNSINAAIYVITRGCEVAAILVMMYKIRNVKEELNIKNELMTIFAITILFSFTYAIPLGFHPAWFKTHII